MLAASLVRATAAEAEVVEVEAEAGNGGCRSSNIVVEFRSNNMVVEHRACTIGVRFRMRLQ